MLSPSQCISVAATPVLAVTLPYPPSVNHYYGKTKFGRQYIKDRGREYRKDVKTIMESLFPNWKPLTDKLQVWSLVNPPDRRKRDLDNLKKCLYDSLTHAGVWEDDSLIDDERAVRGEVKPNGEVTVFIGRITELSTGIKDAKQLDLFELCDNLTKS